MPSIATIFIGGLLWFVFAAVVIAFVHGGTRGNDD